MSLSMYPDNFEDVFRHGYVFPDRKTLTCSVGKEHLALIKNEYECYVVCTYPWNIIKFMDYTMYGKATYYTTKCTGEKEFVNSTTVDGEVADYFVYINKNN